jgi:ATP-dependent Lhr-like helicase
LGANIDNLTNSNGFQSVVSWFDSQGWQVMDFQKETWQAIDRGMHGIVNAPTGSGKTYSIFLGYLISKLNQQNSIKEKSKGLRLIWITPIRALAKEIVLSTERAIEGLGLDWRVELRTGDTTATTKKKQWQNPPQILVTTPESIHILFSQKEHKVLFSNLDMLVIDEWHELIGSKRGVQTELVINRLRQITPSIQVWGISATIGNMAEAIDVLLWDIPHEKRTIIKCDIEKNITIQSVLPIEIERFPWAGHLGLRLADQVLSIIHNSRTTLVFTNTRAMCEIWYQHLLAMDPDLAGQMAMHHGSISKDIREWVEDALYAGHIKAVICTSSLDLGVDFRPVETIIQVGSPKGVARFIQRAGRSGHQPFAESKIWFVPTHALELLEAAGLRMAVADHQLEERIPYIRSFDVLVQYLMTLAVADGFDADDIYDQVLKTYSYHSITPAEWLQVLNYLTIGSQTLQAYDEYKKVEKIGNIYAVTDRKVAQKHKMSIGTIVSDGMINVRLLKGGHLGTIEEYFISQLSPGDVFRFAGQTLEFIRIKEMSAQVRPSQAKRGLIPSYMGGRMPLSSQLSNVLKEKLYGYADGRIDDIEIETIRPILELQQERSFIPHHDEFLVEYFEDNEGHHLLMYPFEGRNVHEGMGALIAKRISMTMPISFIIAMNDLGFELLSDEKIDVDSIVVPSLFSTQHLASDIQSSVNAVEMSRRKFRDIARISGMIFTGYPGKPKKDRHLQSSSQLIYDVFHQYEPDNLLYLQAHEEVMTFQLEEARMRDTLTKIQNCRIIISKPSKATPFSFPIIVDRLNLEKVSSEKLEDRIRKMAAALEK